LFPSAQNDPDILYNFNNATFVERTRRGEFSSMAEKTPGRARKSTSQKKTSNQKTAGVTPINQAGLAQSESKTGSNEARTRASEPSLLELIRVRAYEIFEERGRLDGFDQEDWARAEAEVRARFQREKSA
jgi:DUF2934 family protein